MAFIVFSCANIIAPQGIIPFLPAPAMNLDSDSDSPACTTAMPLAFRVGYAQRFGLHSAGAARSSIAALLAGDDDDAPDDADDGDDAAEVETTVAPTAAAAEVEMTAAPTPAAAAEVEKTAAAAAEVLQVPESWSSESIAPPVVSPLLQSPSAGVSDLEFAQQLASTWEVQDRVEASYPQESIDADLKAAQTFQETLMNTDQQIDADFKAAQKLQETLDQPEISDQQMADHQMAQDLQNTFLDSTQTGEGTFEETQPPVFDSSIAALLAGDDDDAPDDADDGDDAAEVEMTAAPTAAAAAAEVEMTAAPTAAVAAVQDTVQQPEQPAVREPKLNKSNPKYHAKAETAKANPVKTDAETAPEETATTTVEAEAAPAPPSCTLQAGSITKLDYERIDVMLECFHTNVFDINWKDEIKRATRHSLFMEYVKSALWHPQQDLDETAQEFGSPDFDAETEMEEFLKFLGSKPTEERTNFLEAPEFPLLKDPDETVAAAAAAEVEMTAAPTAAAVAAAAEVETTAAQSAKGAVKATAKQAAETAKKSAKKRRRVEANTEPVTEGPAEHAAGAGKNPAVLAAGASVNLATGAFPTPVKTDAETAPEETATTTVEAEAAAAAEVEMTAAPTAAAAKEADTSTASEPKADTVLRVSGYIHVGTGNEVSVQEINQKGRPVLVKFCEKSQQVEGQRKRGKFEAIMTASTGRLGQDRVWNMMNHLAKQYTEGSIPDHTELKRLKTQHLQTMTNDPDGEDYEDMAPLPNAAAPSAAAAASSAAEVGTAAGAPSAAAAEASSAAEAGTAAEAPSAACRDSVHHHAFIARGQP